MKSWRSLDQSKWVAVVLVGVIALAADVWLAVVTSRWGVAVTPDSISYFQNALTLTASEMAASVRLTNLHAPLYPAVLAGPIALGFDPTDAARLLNLVLFPANVALVGFILARLTRSAVAAALGATLTATAQVVLGVHAHAWSEPLFMLFGLLGLYQLGAYAVRGAEWRYWVGLVCLALACLTRYAGIALLLAGAFGLWLRVPSGRRFLRCAGLLVLGVAPTVLWGLPRGLSSGAPLFAGRGLSWHPVTREQAREAVKIVALVLPERFASVITLAALLLSGVALLVGLLLGKPERLRQALGEHRQILAFYGLFLAIYPFFLATCISVYDASLDLGWRLLRFVLYPSGLIVAVSVAWRLLLGRRRIVAVTAAAAFSLLVAMHVRRTVAWSKQYLAVGEGYTGKAWRESATITRIREMGQAAAYYSNAPDAIWFLTGWTASPIPRKVNPATRRADDGFKAGSARMLERMEAEGALLVYLRRTHWRWYLPSEQELAGQLGLELIEDLGDGAFYRAPTRRAGDPHAEVSHP